MTSLATISAPVGGAVIGALIGLFGIVVGLWINGDRTERQRRRELHSRALAAIVDYGEMPFMICRRRSEPEERSAERIRLSDHFSGVKAEISTCQVLLAADGHPQIANAYEELVATARNVVGKEAHEAWQREPIRQDSEMNMGPLFERLTPYRSQLALFQNSLARATLPRRRKWLGRPSREGRARLG